MYLSLYIYIYIYIYKGELSNRIPLSLDARNSRCRQTAAATPELEARSFRLAAVHSAASSQAVVGVPS